MWCYLPPALIGPAWLGVPSSSPVVYDGSQVPSLTATLVVPEILRPDYYPDVILLSLSFGHVRAVVCKMVKGVPYETEAELQLVT